MINHSDTITAVVTPPGRGGVSIIRLCGPTLEPFFEALLGAKPSARRATLMAFLGVDHEVIDQGLVLYFPAPNSFTGEETLELHAHGGPVVVDELLERITELGARQARPGEFSERAFLNGKLDLAQAEAIADLIDASTRQAARGAVRTLKGEFSLKIKVLLDALTQLRVYTEAAIDFPEEEIDFLSDGKVETELLEIIKQVGELLSSSTQGVLLQEGMRVAIAGRPNAGKSSLLNVLAGHERAIVTDIPGTTRDILSEQINLDGLVVHIIDTAGLHDSVDVVEKEGMRRAWEEIAEADQILWLVDGSQKGLTADTLIWSEYQQRYPERNNVSVVVNKADLFKQAVIDKHVDQTRPYIAISALTGQGIDELKAHLKTLAGFTLAGEGVYSARRRHILALNETLECLIAAQTQLTGPGAGELVAEDLRQAQQHLGRITGLVTSDDLLGEIFSGFCIGK